MRSVRCGYVYDNMDDEEKETSSLNSTGAATVEEIGRGTEEEEEVREVEGELDQGRRFLQRMLETTYVHDDCEDFHQTWSIIVLFCVAITFLIFTGCMLVEQIEPILTNQGKIARMKMRVGQGGTELTRVTEEFNEMFGGTSNNVAWHWFVPLPVQFPNGMHKVVMGYEWDPTFDPLPYQEYDEEDPSSNTSSMSEPTATETSNGSASSSKKDGQEKFVDEPPQDLETGLPQEDLDEVSIDEASAHSSASSAKLKKRPPKSVPPVV